MQARPGQFARAILVASQILNRASTGPNAPEGYFDQPVAQQVLAGLHAIGPPVIAGRIAGVEQGRKGEVHGDRFVKRSR